MLDRRLSTLAIVCTALLGGSTAAHAAVPEWTTYHRDALRSGVDPDSSSPVTPSAAWQTQPLDGDVYGQPLLYGSSVYVATENDSVYALDSTSGRILWHTSVGTAVPGTALPCGDITTVGITSTPVIDPATQRIYVVADTWDGSNKSSITHVLDGLRLSDGGAVPGLPRPVDPPGSIPADQLQRAALALDAGRIIIGYGGNDGDCGTYHGWLVAAPETGTSPLLTFEAGPSSGVGGAVWGAGNGPAVDATGSIWTATGNSTSGSAYGYQESVLKLDPSLSLQASWAPANWQELDNGDRDLGSSDPLLLPHGLLFQIGKQGVGYLLSQASLPGLGGKPAFQADVCPGYGSYGGGIYRAGVIYVACRDGIHALTLNLQAPSFSALPGWRGDPGAIGPPIFAGGLLWSVGWNTGALYGLDPTGGTTLFSSALGAVDHFASPSAGGGRLFVGNGNRVSAFTIAKYPPPPPPPPPKPPALSKLRLSVSGSTITLKLSLSEPATVTIVLWRLVPGRVVKGHCMAGAKRGRRCTLVAAQARRRFAGRRGANALRIRLRQARAGRYVLETGARDAGGRVSKLHVLRFTIPR